MSAASFWLVFGWFSLLRVLRHWNRQPREAVDLPSLEALQARLDGAVSNLVWREVSLPIAGVGMRLS